MKALLLIHVPAMQVRITRGKFGGVRGYRSGRLRKRTRHWTAV